MMDVFKLDCNALQFKSETVLHMSLYSVIVRMFTGSFFVVKFNQNAEQRQGPM